MGFWSYERVIWNRAWSETLEFIGWKDWFRMLWRVGVPAISLIGLALFGYTTQLVNRSAAVASAAAAAAFLFLVVLAIRASLAPSKIDQEKQDKILELTGKLEDRRNFLKIVERLESIYHEGEKLTTLKKSDNPHEYRQSVINWFDEIEEYITAKLPETSFSFRTVSERPAPKQAFDECGPMLKTRLAKLRSIIGSVRERTVGSTRK